MGNRKRRRRRRKNGRDDEEEGKRDKNGEKRKIDKEREIRPKDSKKMRERAKEN